MPEALAQPAESFLDMTRRAYNFEIISYRVIRDRWRASWHPRRKMTNHKFLTLIRHSDEELTIRLPQPNFVTGPEGIRKNSA